MNKFLTSLLQLLFILCAFQAHSQNKVIESSWQSWTHLFFQYQNANDWTWQLNSVFRWDGAFEDPAQYLIRTAGHYSLDPGFSVGGGLVYSGFYRHESIYRTELRPYTEISFKQAIKFGTIANRFRAEYRMFDLKDNEIDPSNWRFRYNLSLSIPILKLGNPSTNRMLKLKLADEIFLNAGADIGSRIFDKNRIMIGPVIELSAPLSIECLYMHQFRSTQIPNEFSLNHVVWMRIKYSIKKLQSDS